ncbi:hypothetical protein [Serratia marcescens]|uniref:hypothetical protein n=1 Tax=Serratia marcescens TaxID=615 RepID=UPI003D6FA487
MSELSNPAWIVGQQEIADFMRGDEALLVRGYDPESTEPALRMYSQEYASALLAELEAKDKRIVALERINKAQEDHINQQQDRIESLEKKNGDLGHGLQAAEKRIAGLVARLATPVRLPNKNDAEFWFGSTFQVAKFDRAVERAISAAGFKFVGNE